MNRDDLRNDIMSKIIGKNVNNEKIREISESKSNTKNNQYINFNNLKNDIYSILEKYGYNLKDISTLSAVSLFFENLGRL